MVALDRGRLLQAGLRLAPAARHDLRLRPRRPRPQRRRVRRLLPHPALEPGPGLRPARPGRATSSRTRWPAPSPTSTSARASGSKATTAAAGARPTEQLTDATFAQLRPWARTCSPCTACTTRPTAAGGNGPRPATTSACPTGRTWASSWPASQRLSYLLSQGVHRCDVAIALSRRAVEAGLGGNEAVDAAFDAGRTALRGRASTSTSWTSSRWPAPRSQDKELRVTGETLSRAGAAGDAGGAALARSEGGRVPARRRRGGRPGRAARGQRPRRPRRSRSWPRSVAQAVTTRSPRPEQVAALVAKAGPARLRRAVARRGPRRTSCTARSARATCSWSTARRRTPSARSAPRARSNCGTRGPAQTRPLRVVVAKRPKARGCGCRWTEQEAQLIVFSPGEPQHCRTHAVAAGRRVQRSRSTAPGSSSCSRRWTTVSATSAGRRRRRSSAPRPGSSAMPTRATPNPGWQAAGFDDSKWPKVDPSRSGRSSGSSARCPDGRARRRGLARLDARRSRAPVEVGGRRYAGSPTSSPGAGASRAIPATRAITALKEQVTTSSSAWERGHAGRAPGDYRLRREPRGSRYYLWTTRVFAAVGKRRGPHRRALATAAWLDGQPLVAPTADGRAAGGARIPLLLRYDGARDADILSLNGRSRPPCRCRRRSP